MTQEQISKLENSIENIKNKKSRIYFIVQDTKGNAKASLAYIYRFAMSLLNEGYNPIMLHEKTDYTGVSGWLGSEYDEKLPQDIFCSEIEMKFKSWKLKIINKEWTFIQEKVELFSVEHLIRPLASIMHAINRS
jgi:hypothetical protein